MSTKEKTEQRIRIKRLKSFDSRLIDQSSKRLL